MAGLVHGLLSGSPYRVNRGHAAMGMPHEAVEVPGRRRGVLTFVMGCHHVFGRLVFEPVEIRGTHVSAR